MKQSTLSKWLKFIILGVGVCGILVYAVFVPEYGRSTVEANPEFTGWFVPWLVFLSVTALPCYAALVLAWKIAVNIGCDRSFSTENARYLKWISFLAAGDALYFFIGNVVMLVLDMNHPGIALASLLIVFAGLAVTVASAALSHLVGKAAALQEQSDLTI
ncbi:MAG: DUF2975 domain-containing protein [Oscillospiraceae bacterium]|nr:DUF2975 domain-containing protein [Oscillospiraceae bacterium]